MYKKLIVVLILTNVLLLCTVRPTSAQDFIKPPDNFILDGIPNIPSSLVTTINRYTNSRAAFLASWHPHKREMLINTSFGDVPQIHRVQFPGGDRKQITFESSYVTEGLYEPTKGEYFIYGKDPSGSEYHQFYRFDVAKGESILLTDGKSRNFNPKWSHSKELLAYGSTRRNGKDCDLYLINPSQPQTNKLLAQVEGPYWVALDWSSDDQKILAYQHLSPSESQLWVIDVNTGEKTLITPKEGAEKVAYRKGQFSRDGKGVYVTTDKNSEFEKLAYIDLKTKKLSFIPTDSEWSVEDIVLAPDGKTLAFLTSEDGASRIHLLSTSTRKEIQVPQLSVGVINKIEWHSNSRDLGFVMQSAKYPTDVYSLDCQTKKVERWTHSETGGLNTENFSEAQVIRYKSADSKTISGFMYLPPTSKFQGKRPVIIDIHGGPAAQSKPIYIARSNYYLNELGVAIIYPNVRGSSGYGKTFQDLDNGISRASAYEDIGSLLDWISTQNNLDSTKVLVQGSSYGGHMALVTATKYSDRIKAAISIVGPSNLLTFLENTEEWLKDLRREELGDERNPKVKEFFESPLHHTPTTIST